MHIIKHTHTLIHMYTHIEKPFATEHTEIPTVVINTYFIAVKWGQSQNNDVIISSKCIYRDGRQEQRGHAI